MLTLRLLGKPMLSDSQGRTVRFPSRKSEALFLHLALRHDRCAPRGWLCHLLWGDRDEERARASLRQCLRQLAALSPLHGPLVAADRSSVRLTADPLVTDLDGLDGEGEGLVEACRRTLGVAVAAGHLLDGAEIGEEAYDDWLRDMRLRIAGDLAGRLTAALETIAPGDAARGNAGEAAARVLQAVEPFDEFAYEWRIRHFVATGRRDLDLRQFARYARMLREEFDVAPPAEIARLVGELRGPAERPAEASPPGVPVPAPARVSGATTPADERPRITVQPTASFHPLPDVFRFAIDEVLHKLSRFRGIRCFETGGGGAVTLEPRPFCDYLLRLSTHPDRQVVHLSVVEATTGEVILRDRLAAEALADADSAERAVARCVNAIERDVLVAYRRGNGPSTTFGRWLEALALMSRFEPAADDEALRILEAMAEDPVDTRFSLVHSSIGSILMKRRLMRPPESPTAARSLLAEAEKRAQIALSADREEPFNHVVAGWAAFQAGRHTAGIAAFQQALELNPASARTNMSAAEAFGYAGDAGRARELAATAMRLMSPPFPPYFYGYLAMIEYVAGDFDTCLSLCEKAPRNAETATLQVAALSRRGDGKAARSAADRLIGELAIEHGRSCTLHDVGAWLAGKKMFRDPGERARWSESLALAGIPVPEVRAG